MHMVPHRIREHIQKEWQVGFEEPRFLSTFWNRFFVFLGASENLVVRLDKMGSEIWGHIDSERNVRRILSMLELKHPDKENLRDRLVHYLKRLEYHGYIELREAGVGVTVADESKAGKRGAGDDEGRVGKRETGDGVNGGVSVDDEGRAGKRGTGDGVIREE